MAPRCVLVWSKELVRFTKLHPRNEGRDVLLSDLFHVFGVFEAISKDGGLWPPRPASEAELLEFHSQEYLSFLKGHGCEDQCSCESQEEHAQLVEEHGLVDDCFLFPGVWEYVRWVAGASLLAAKALCSGVPVSLCWTGGRHHALRDSARGLCYVNDIVLCVLMLQNHGYRRVMYIDVDVHHADGVESAFQSTEEVFCLSFHYVGPGFFPGTGVPGDTGTGAGRYRTLNVPLPLGLRDEEMIDICVPTVAAVGPFFRPQAVVIQCGCDGLSGDPVGACWNLTTAGLTQCIHSMVVLWQVLGVPVILLGGGGYNPANSARFFCQLTARVGAIRVEPLIPSQSNFLLHYAPSFALHTRPSLDGSTITATQQRRRYLNEAWQRVVEFTGNMT